MPLPHFRAPLKEGWVGKDDYDVIFIYNEYKPENRIVSLLDCKFDVENDNNTLKLLLVDTYELSHNFGDIILVVVHVYNQNGEIIRRKVFDVELTHYRQTYETDNFERYIEGNYSRIELLFRINQYDVSDFKAGNSIPFDVWFRDYKINKIIG